MSDATLATLVSHAWGVAGGLALALLAIVAIARRSPRAWGTFAFLLFLAIWGTQVVAANAATFVTDPGAASTIYLVDLTLLLPLPFLILSFARDHTGSRVMRVLPPLAAALALTLTAILVVAPELLFRGLAPAAHSIQPQWGPLYAPLVTVPLYVSDAIALLALARAYARAPTPALATRNGVVLAGMSMIVAFAIGDNLAFYALDAAFSDADAATFLYASLFLVTAALVVWLGVRALRRGRIGRTARERAEARWIALALVGPLACGIVEGALDFGPLPLFSTLGLWRLAGAAIVAYGLLRWTTPDLAQRARKGATTAVGVTAGIGAASVGFVLSSSVVTMPWSLVVASATGMAFTFPSLRLMRRVVGEKPELDEASLFGQRVETYRAALESSIARGTLDEDAPFLATLRERFEIGDEAHRVLMHYARSTVITARDGKIEGAYEKLRLLGEGSAGRTWLARDRNRDRLVVLKEPIGAWHDGPVREQVLKEARLAARVRHANVVRVEDVVQDGASTVIVMEYVEGGSLLDTLRARGQLPWREAARVADELLEGLGAIHAAGILHRDLKPSNVLMTREGKPKIADFGIAVAKGRAGTVIFEGGAEASTAGTLAYMPPEVRAATARASEASDAYAVAALLHECLYGAPPSPHAPTLHQDVPAPLARVLSRALSPDPRERPQSARELQRQIAEALA